MPFNPTDYDEDYEAPDLREYSVMNATDEDIAEEAGDGDETDS